MPRAVRQVVWNELDEDGDVFQILSCGHVQQRAAPMATAVCEMCPENLPGDDAPLKHWLRVRYVELGDGA